MIFFVIATLSICAYLASAALIIRGFACNRYRSTALLLAWLGVASHTAYIVQTILQNTGFSFSFFSTASLISMIVALLLLLATTKKPVEKLGVAVFPIAALMLGLAYNFDGTTQRLSNDSWAMTSHVLSSIIAFSLLNIAALQAMLLAVQDQQLKSHPPKRFIQSLPSLQAMESLLFQMLTVGLFFLTLSLLSGFFFIDDLFAQHLVHKTVLSLLAWVIFSALLLGRSLYGWRGRTAMRWTVSGFGLLLLAYFGSKLVLKLILHR